MDKIIVTNITYDMVTRAPAYVIIGVFDHRGTQQMSFTWPGKLFSKDIDVGDDVVLVTRPKDGEATIIKG